MFSTLKLVATVFVVEGKLTLCDIMLAVTSQHILLCAGLKLVHQYTRQVEQKPGGRGREWATLGVHPLSWLLSNNRLEKVPFVSVPYTSSNRLLLSNQDKGCTPSVAHSLALPLGPTLLNLWNNTCVNTPVLKQGQLST